MTGRPGNAGDPTVALPRVPRGADDDTVRMDPATGPPGPDGAGSAATPPADARGRDTGNPDADAVTAAIPPVAPQPAPARSGSRRQSLGRASGLIAIASLSSRITGFIRQVALVAVLGLGFVNSSYTVANTLPNIVYELLLGGVLSSVMIPLLVRAQTEDDDGGETYTRKLLTVLGVLLLVATVLAILAAPLLTALYLGGQGGSMDAHTEPVSPELATAFAVLLLPQIFFYGVGAVLGAILNSKGVFGPFAWAPVLNNVVVLAVLGVFVLVPGEISVDPVRLGDAKLLVLGLGTTLGIVVQAVVLLPALRRVGVRFRPLWGWDPRLTSAGGLAIWVLAYVLIGQIGYIVTTRLAWASDPGGPAIYQNAWLLLQVPYGVIGVSVLTALMPRLSRAAAENRTADVVADLSLGTRLATVSLLPISLLLTLLGPAIGVALYGFGEGAGNAARLGAALTVSAFGLLPFAVMMLQLRVFYALTDSRTPTIIQLVIVSAKVPMMLACPALMAPEHVVLGLSAANSASFVFGAALGNVLLRRRVGPTRGVPATLWRTALASITGGVAAYLAVGVLAQGPMGQLPDAARAWAVLSAVTVVFGLVTLVTMRVVRVRELDPLWRRANRSRKASQQPGS